MKNKKTKRIRVYKTDIPDDNRFAIFAQWLKQEETVLIPNELLETVTISQHSKKQQDDRQNQFIQLSLF